MKLAGCTWGISPLHRAQLYRSITERTIAPGVSAWGRHFSYRMQTKLNQIQRPFLLNIAGAYRTTPTAALQAITGILPLEYKFEAEAKFSMLTRLRKPITDEGKSLTPEEIEEKSTGCAFHPAEFFEESRIQAAEDLQAVGDINIYTDGSKTAKGVASAFCITNERQELQHHWQGHLKPNS
ncbi:hypothetical protein AVEN_220202-1 [Araneus ventricosus]|uniref:RNase H type-1 domain-containing protein n=1 Tax=Araneus ventricosus TaxID=182803 RepID=A0A4Y2GZZ0_ARAVE|nr:hypothetical protein AVEN_220202-1 [Araneus ventricosus]